MGEDGTVPLGHDGKGEGAVVVLHHTHVVVALGQRSLSLDVETVGVPCTHSLAQTHSEPGVIGCADLWQVPFAVYVECDHPCWLAPA